MPQAFSLALPRLWWRGVVNPPRAFEELIHKPAPLWGFWVVLVFNILISATTLLARYLLGRPPLMESVLTFLPSEKYLLPEMFFLPPLRILVWLMGAAVIHLGLRLARAESNFDLILNIGGLGYLVIMPFILISDWIFVALNAYGLAAYVHSLAAPWSILLTAIGLKKVLGAKIGLAVGLSLVSEVISIPILAIFAR